MTDSLIDNPPTCVATLRCCPSSPERVSAMAGMRIGVRETNEGGAAVAERGHEGKQSITAATDRREVRLHLQARRGLKAHHRITANRLERPDECLELADPAGVTGRLNLAHQHRRRDPVRARLLDALEQIGLEGIELAGPRCARPVLHL